MKHLVFFFLLLIAIYKIAESFALNLRYGELFDVQINIWIYRVIWVTMAGVSIYALVKYYKDQRQFARR